MSSLEPRAREMNRSTRTRKSKTTTMMMWRQSARLLLRLTMSLLLLLCLVRWATPVHAQIPQHRVRRTRRIVPYRHVLEGAQKRVLPKFWIPSEHGDELRSGQDVRESHRRMERQTWWRTRGEESSERGAVRIQPSQGDDEPAFWYVHGDASVRSPEGRQGEHKTQARGLRSRVKPTSPKLLSSIDQHGRRIQVEDKFASAESGSQVHVSETTVGLEDEEEEILAGATGNSTEDGWNVTSQVETSANDTSPDSSSTVVYTSATSEEGSNSSSFHQPIRIRGMLSEYDHGGTFLNETERETLFQSILSPAILAWSAALRVDPVVGNLTVDAEQLYDGQTCGPGLDSGFPSVPVPLSHFTTGIPDTDLLVYLTIGFSGAGESSTNESSPFTWGGLSDKTSDIIGNKKKYRWEFDPKEIYWNSPPSCSGEYLAAASYCSTDQYDRPTAAMLHLCIDDGFFLESALQRNIVTVMHELGHVLGFNAQSFAHFRRSDGSPITDRVDGDVVDSEVECTGPSPRRNRTIPLPSPEILQFRMVRGIRVAEIVSPSVRQVVRNHFDCQTMNGAELESGVAISDNDSTTTEMEGSCIGDHWEKRLFSLDLMNPVLDEVSFSLKISSVTLAVLADSGWYQVDLSRTAYASTWGRGTGCSFVENSCISVDGQVPTENRPFFCNNALSAQVTGTDEEINGCSPDLTRKATCSLAQYDSDLPSEYQYFDSTFGSSVGGSEPFLDYCPVFSGFANGLCKDRQAKRFMKVSDIESFGSKNSRCLTGTIVGKSTAFCMSTACVIEDRSLRVNVDGAWRRCKYGGQRLLASSSSILICPDPVRACPAFYCERDCLGTEGICDYTTGECVCQGYVVSNTTDSVGTSAGNSTSGLEFGTMCGGVSPDDQGFYSEAQGSRSPLADPSVADYYYPSEDDLDGDKRRLPIWAIILISVVGCGSLVAAVFLIWWKRNRERRSAFAWFHGFQPGDDPVEVVGSSSSGKDKFVASMLVDMRIHGPAEPDRGGSRAESLSATDGSITETDGSDNATVSSLNQSVEGGDDHASNSSVSLEASSEKSVVQLPRRALTLVAQSVMRKRVVTDSNVND